MITPESLPNDTVELKGIVCQLLDVVEQQKRLIANQNERIEAQFLKMEEQSQKIEQQSQRIDQLTDQVNALKRYRYGKRSEKIPEEKTKPDNVESSPDGYVAVTFGNPWWMVSSLPFLFAEFTTQVTTYNKSYNQGITTTTVDIHNQLTRRKIFGKEPAPDYALDWVMRLIQRVQVGIKAFSPNIIEELERSLKVG